MDDLGAIERISIDTSVMAYSPDNNDGEPQNTPLGVIMLGKDNNFKMTKRGKGLLQV